MTIYDLLDEDGVFVGMRVMITGDAPATAEDVSLSYPDTGEYTEYSVDMFGSN